MTSILRAPTQSTEENSQEPGNSPRILEVRQYESIEFEHALQHPKNVLINAYVIRKALIRKHYLLRTVENWRVKHPDSVLARHFKAGVDFEVDFAEFLDDALVEAYELHESFAKNETAPREEREWWILKPGMSDRGQGIRLFSSMEELQEIFEEWEEEEPLTDEEEEDIRSQDGDGEKALAYGDGIITSQLRHFIAQPYIHPALLFASEGNRKFHIRTYVLAVGGLNVYVYRDMLALFAAEEYRAPWDSTDLRGHLTNTCLQDSSVHEGSVRRFWDLDEVLPNATGTGEPGEWKEKVFEQICELTAETFEAAARGMSIHFQTLPNAFEVFGLDFMLDGEANPWLLEINAFPDFRQTGDDLMGVVQGFFDDTIDLAVKPFFGIEKSVDDGRNSRHVLDIDLGRR
ncbi:tubulin-tyrosine ligase [Eremomyces bilateralis CBS 781.70]|uniref:Tubulin-tyrosine ligase n=1 Tax=Eremomyces bilateralis CBS 781.70 TaxID=1392243 RepID=A0A6G1G476_9PEZI|nr:tubulin-tyrosine ligase [Eremomyces bilateralis CBS 781.70]KAF1812863.1 tubulin-tyrosine ligase [Eremomyces bilateralis CBS 781.70]